MANEIAKLFVAIGIKDAEFNKGLKGMEKKMRSVGANMTKIGAGITATVGLIGGASLKMAADFDSAMREVNTMMQLGEAEFQDFSKEVREMSSALGVDAVDSVKALYQAISAGVPRENVIEFLQVATKAAIGGVTDTITAVDGLTTVLNAFKMPISDAQKVADIMFTTVKGGKTTFDELSASLFNVAPIAAASNVKFEEVAAALATMTKQGVPTAQATTQLRQAMVALQKPTEEMQAAIDALGYESGQAMLKSEGFAETLRILRDATKGNNEVLMRMFGSVEAGQAVLALTGQNAQTFAADLDAMRNSAGAATAAFDQMEQSTSRQMETLKAQFKDTAISIGTALMPALQQVIEAIKPIIEQVGRWIKENPELAKNILIAAGAVGGLLAVLGPLLMMLPAIAAGFTLMFGPVGLVIVGIMALAAAGVALWKNWDKITHDVALVWNRVVEYFQRLWRRVVEIFTGIGRAMWEPIKNAIQWIIDYINALIKTIQALFSMFTGKGGGGAGGEGKGGRPYIGAEESARRAAIFREYQGGGIVPGLPGQAVPAIVHGGEHIFEPGELGSFAAELSGILESLAGGRETPVQMYLDGEKVGEVLLRRSGEKYMQLSHIGGLNR